MSDAGRARLLAGKRVLITGASRGIGAVVARRLASQGAELILVARDEKALLQVAAGLESGPHRVEALDVTDARAWDAVREVVLADRAVDAVVTAAAALAPIGPLGSWDISSFRETLDLNVCGTLLAILTCLDALRAAHGSIITFSGGGATAPMPRYDAYAASKAAVVRLTENLAVDLGTDSDTCQQRGPRLRADADARRDPRRRTGARR